MSTADNAIARGRDNASRGAPRRRAAARPRCSARSASSASRFSLPATRLAVADLDPWFVAFGRAAVAAVLAARVPRASRARRARRARSGARSRSSPPASSSASRCSPRSRCDVQTAAHGAVVIALLPAATAVARSLRARRAPEPRVLARRRRRARRRARLRRSRRASAALAAARPRACSAPSCCARSATPRAARSSRTLGGARTICWALVLAAPLTRAGRRASRVGASRPARRRRPRGSASPTSRVVSMFLGFFAWYAGLARGGVARIGQVQLAQPVLTLALVGACCSASTSAPATLLTALAVLACVAATQRARVTRSCSAAWPSTTDAVGKTLPARCLRGRAREDPRVRARGGRDEPAAPRRRGRARRRLPRRRRAADVRRRLLRAGDRRRRSSTPRSGSTSRCMVHGGQEFEWGAAGRRRRRDHDDRDGQGHLRARRQWASTSSSPCPPTRTATRCASAPGPTSCEVA